MNTVSKFLSWCNENKPHLIMLAVIVLQTVAANHWLIIPPDVMAYLTGLGTGAGVGLIPHSNALRADRVARANFHA